MEAKFPQTLAAKTSGMSTSEEVVRESLKALERGYSTVVIGGFTTHFISKLARFVPRKTLLFSLKNSLRIKNYEL